jgi:IS30 family transposase
MKQNYKHLTLEERYTLERMRKEGYSQEAIATCLGRSESTISREVNRNCGGRGYRHKQAHRMANQRRYESRNRKKFTVELQAKIEVHLREDFSPEQVSGLMSRPSTLDRST